MHIAHDLSAGILTAAITWVIDVFQFLDHQGVLVQCFLFVGFVYSLTSIIYSQKIFFNNDVQLPHTYYVCRIKIQKYICINASQMIKWKHTLFSREYQKRRKPKQFCPITSSNGASKILICYFGSLFSHFGQVHEQTQNLNQMLQSWSHLLWYSRHILSNGYPKGGITWLIMNLKTTDAKKLRKQCWGAQMNQQYNGRLIQWLCQPHIGNWGWEIISLDAVGMISFLMLPHFS